jgi:cytochrome c oxidase subunit 2
MKARSLSRLCLLLGVGSIAISCGGPQSAVDAAGIQADRLASLWWIFFWVTAVVYVVVIAFLIIAWIRNKRSDEASLPDTHPDSRREGRAKRIVGGAVGITVVTLFVLMITSFRTGSAINSLGEKQPALAVKITGHQWWWEVEYQDEQTPSNNVTTANELHVPVGRLVKVMLQSNDVIHSLWMPNLAGKKDLVPIYPTTFYFEADKPGTYWGQCAEFCGYQHAKMRIAITAESPEDFQTWLDAGRQTPPTPAAGTIEDKGRDIFLQSVCTQCHTIQGTNANGRVGPSLTHIAERPYIAAGSLQTTEDNLRSWITDPQHIKPGVYMPMNEYSDQDLTALVSYLRSLK